MVRDNVVNETTDVVDFCLRCGHPRDSEKQRVNRRKRRPFAHGVDLSKDITVDLLFLQTSSRKHLTDDRSQEAPLPVT